MSGILSVLNKPFIISRFIINDLFIKGRLARYFKRALKEDYDLVPSYNEDGVVLYGKNCRFLTDQYFSQAYSRGLQATNSDFNIRYRVYVLLWAARNAATLKGDFVECGVARGMVSSAIMNCLDWNQQQRKYFLLDTFTGLDEKELTAQEKKNLGDVSAYNALSAEKVYADNFDDVVKNFSEWKNVEIVKGTIPATLEQVTSEEIAFLHIDLNCVTPEIAALDFFWPKMSRGGMVVLDDYAHGGHYLQMDACDKWAKENNVNILTMPTGQGLIVKT